MAVIVAGELHDHRPAGVSAGQPDGAERGLRARVDQAELLHRGHGGGDQLGQLVFGQGGGAEAAAAAGGPRDGRRDLGPGVAEDHRPPGADVIEVAIAVEIDQRGPLGLLDEDRLAAHGAEGPCRAVDSSGDELFCAGEGGVAFLAGHGRGSWVLPVLYSRGRGPGTRGRGPGEGTRDQGPGEGKSPTTASRGASGGRLLRRLPPTYTVRYAPAGEGWVYGGGSPTAVYSNFPTTPVENGEAGSGQDFLKCQFRGPGSRPRELRAASRGSREARRWAP